MRATHEDRDTDRLNTNREEWTGSENEIQAEREERAEESTEDRLTPHWRDWADDSPTTEERRGREAKDKGRERKKR